jgi:phospholipid transport system transporter-binding protein
LSGAILVPQSAGRIAVTGALDFSTVEGLLRQIMDLLDDPQPWVVDLGGITHADSAGLALLLEWTDQARRRGRELLLTDLPASLTDIARMSNCLELLPLRD